MSNVKQKPGVTNKSQLKAPQVTDPDVQRAIEKIYEDLNILKDSTNIEVGTASEEREGKPGDIRIVRESGKFHILEIRTKDGWKRGKAGVDDIRYYSSGSRKKYEPATVTVNEDTGETEIEEPPPPLTEGEVSTQIEQALSDYVKWSDKTEFQAPDAESPWIDLSYITHKYGTNGQTWNHGLGVVPRHIQFFTRGTSSGAECNVPDSNVTTHYHGLANNIGGGLNHGVTWQATNSSVIVHTGNHAFSRIVHGTTHHDSFYGKIKILAWK